MPLSAKEYTDITALIKLILNGYPGNAAILREYLQNSDDAKATLQRFIFDERTFPNTTLVDPALKDSQGAALIAINDGLLEDADWMALRKINSSSKQTDESQTGKNGLGFRASYHLTENPHVISGRSLMILDPHHEFEVPHDGGVSIDILEEGEQYRDQLSPFNSYRPAGEGVNGFYNGTAFRLPLRTEDQAKRSKIKSTPTSVEDMRKVLHDFVSNEFEEVILFLKHITTIEVIHINPSGEERCLAKVTVNSSIPSPIPSSWVRRTTVVSSNGDTTTRDWKICCVNQSKTQAKALMDLRLGYDIEDRLTKEKLSPSVDMAYPLGGPPIRGRLFTLLPFPLWTNFPIHLNAVFALDPNRQNLKNIQEVGSGTSRERMLVEWNKLIFDTWTPDIWANLLADLSGDILRVASWTLWPPEEYGLDCYWKGLAASLTKSVVDRRLPVFPTVAFNSEARLVCIDDPDVLLATSNPAISLDILCSLGILVVQPPTHIFDIIVALSATNAQISQLSPHSLHRILSQRPAGDFEKCEGSQLRQILDYLAFSSVPPTGNLTYIHGLPCFQRTKDGQRVPLGLNNSGTKYIIPQTQTETIIFSAHPTMLAWDSMSERLRNALSSVPTALNVSVLGSPDVFTFLRQRLSHLSSTEDEITNVMDDHQWVVDFWSWVIEWTKATEFFRGNLQEVSNLFLLPTSRGSLRKLSSRIAHFADGEFFVESWKTLGVYPISPDLPHSVVIKLKDASFIPTVRTWPHVAFMIKNCDIKPPNVSDEILKSTFKDVRTSLFECLPRSPGSALSSTEKSKLRKFPIFMTRDGVGVPSKLNNVDGHCRYVDVDEHLPLPYLQAYPNMIYVDMRDSTTQSLLRLVESSVTIEKELQLLQLAVDNWECQPPDHQDVFIDRIFSNSYQLPAQLRQSLGNIAFVTVNDCGHHVTPRDLIHPRSILSELYRGEPAKIPTGRFSQDDYLSIMQRFGFVRSTLDPHIVQDRLQYLSTTSQLDDLQLHDKASNFLRLLDRYWNEDYKEFVVLKRNAAWLPTIGPPVLMTPSQCRDNYHGAHAHPYYYDLVLKVFETTLNSAFRDALGWSSAVPSGVLSVQVISTLDLTARLSFRSNRLVKLIIYLNQLHSAGCLGDVVLRDLQASLVGRAWVPSNSLGNVVEAQYALLEETPLKPPFCSVDSSLTRLPFLRLMGCSNRPPISLLLDQLHRILGLLPRQGPSYPFTSSLGREAAIAILQEIATHHQSDIAQSGIHIPCENDQAYPLNDVYFRDMKHASLSPAMQGKFAAHSIISSSLAESLGIQLLSSIALGDDDDDDDDEEQMSEDLVTRIKGFLRDYDPKFALTEFLANADDARADHFSLLLDTGRQHRFNQGRIISPPFQSLMESPSLILHNNSKMSRKDFIGIRRIGQGGKLDKIETHGRHGLGALSFYYFTDVVTVISGDTVMILDPSGNYLPPRIRRGKRTTLTRKLSEFVSSFPDQLKPYENLFDFSAQNPVYNGTLFCLPLRAKISEKASDLVKTRRYIETSYRQLAQQAFFFTDLEKITAIGRADGVDSLFWSFSASRARDRPFGNIDIRDVQIKSLSVDPRSQNVEHWIIATSETGEVPEQHLNTAFSMKLAPKNVKVQLAINIANVENETFIGYPFSTVPLPKSISLPFHINARFAISSNRQSLVINSVDSQNQKDAYTSFNTWILESLVPSLYLETLQNLVQRGERSPPVLKSKLWWSLTGSDDVSKLVKDALFRTLPQSDARVFKASDRQWVTFSQSIFSRGEPPLVKELLQLLKVPYFVRSQRHSDISRSDNANYVNPQFVRQAVLMNKAQLLSLGASSLKREHFLIYLDYIRDEPSLVGLPLLRLTSYLDVIPIPGQAQDPVFHSENPQHASFFSSSVFVAHGYSEETMQRLITDDTVNVASLTGHNVINLIDNELRTLTAKQKPQWIQSFWDTYYDTLPGPPSLNALASRSMLLIEGSTSAISLTQCSPRLVVYGLRHSSVLYPWLSKILQSLHIGLVMPPRNSTLQSFLEKRFPNFLDNVLQCIYAKGIHLFDDLSADLVDKFSEWVQRELPSTLKAWKKMLEETPITKAQWAQLPIWSAYQNGTARRRSAADIVVLPSHVDISHVFPFLNENIILAAWSAELSIILELCVGNKNATLSPFGIMAVITLPTQLKLNGQLEDMKRFLRSMLRSPTLRLTSIGLGVPDQHGHLRSVEDLYDDTNGLFAMTLKFTPRPSFIHSDFREFLPQLRGLGLVHQVTFDTFQHCANAVSGAFQAYGPNSDNWQYVCQMSASAFTAYQTSVPPLVWNTVGANWTTLDAIQFVQKKAVRRQGVSYHVQAHYCAEDLPEILAPSQFVLSKFEPIAWTQRALFLSEPSNQVVTVNPKLGVPAAREVVAHLKILTVVIANDHPGDLTLLSDIKATYQWLSANANEARVHLQEIENEKIFLNVDDPTIESWSGKWASGKELVLNLQYDVRPIKYVREFLGSFEPLLLAAGCQAMKRRQKLENLPPPSASSTEASVRQWKDGFNKLRLSGQFTDVVLIPTGAASSIQSVEVTSLGTSRESVLDEDEVSITAPHLGPGREVIEDVVVDSAQLRAHRVVLAVALPHILTLQTWSSVDNDAISFFGSAFGAKAVLDFVYTGEFELSTPTEDEQVLSRLMRDLLELLSVAEEWDMKDLKEKIQWEIIHKHDMIQRLPHQFDTLLEQAKTYNAQMLVEELERFERMHGNILQALRADAGNEAD